MCYKRVDNDFFYNIRDVRYIVKKKKKKPPIVFLK